jgi:hypothetical protein
MRRSPYYRKLSRAAQLRRLARHKAALCWCDGWPFPHRAGSRAASPHAPGCTQPAPRW